MDLSNLSPLNLGEGVPLNSLNQTLVLHPKNSIPIVNPNDFTVTLPIVNSLDKRLRITSVFERLGSLRSPSIEKVKKYVSGDAFLEDNLDDLVNENRFDISKFEPKSILLAQRSNSNLKSNATLLNNFGSHVVMDSVNYDLVIPEQKEESHQQMVLDWIGNRLVFQRSTLALYQSLFEWSGTQLIEDYAKIGSSIDEITKFVITYRLDNSKAKSLHSYAIEEGGIKKIKLTNDESIDLSSHLSLFEDKLSKKLRVENLVDIIITTKELYQNRRGHMREFINKRLVNMPRGLSTQGMIDYLEGAGRDLDNFNEFATERKNTFDQNVSFLRSAAKNTFELYLGLGKSFDQFKRDFEKVGNTFQLLSRVYGNMFGSFGEEKTNSIIRYVAKKKSRDMINTLSDCPTRANSWDNLTSLIKGESKDRIVLAITEYNQAWNFLGERSALGVMDSALASLNEGHSFEDVMVKLKGVKEKFYEPITGGSKVPDSLEEEIDRIVFAYYKNSGLKKGVEVKPALEIFMPTYIEKGEKAALEKVRSQEGNQKVRKLFQQRGVDIDLFEKGIVREYNLSTDGKERDTILEQISDELSQVIDRMGRLNLSYLSPEVLEFDLDEKIEYIELFLDNYHFKESDLNLRDEIKGHFNKAKSLNGSSKEGSGTALFYVSEDLVEALHMGQYFGSCLSLTKNHNAVNSWASVVQVMDSNKNVIYAKDLNGDYIGRNRTVLTDDGVLCTRFYQNGSLNMNQAWIDYLTDFGKELSQDMMIPVEFTKDSMKEILEEKVKEGSVVIEDRELTIEPAYFDTFYGDGLKTKHCDDGTVYVKAKMYVIQK